MWQRWQDEAGGAYSVPDPYGEIIDQAGGLANAQSFARVFMLPAGSHGQAAGDAIYSLNVLPDLINWIETGQAPQKLDAWQTDSTAAVTRTYPVYPLPEEAKYTRQGNVDDEANWTSYVPIANLHFRWLDVGIVRVAEGQRARCRGGARRITSHRTNRLTRMRAPLSTLRRLRNGQFRDGCRRRPTGVAILGSSTLNETPQWRRRRSVGTHLEIPSGRLEIAGPAGGVSASGASGTETASRSHPDHTPLPSSTDHNQTCRMGPRAVRPCSRAALQKPDHHAGFGQEFLQMHDAVLPMAGVR